LTDRTAPSRPTGDTRQPARVLVTGGAGFIGSHLVELLAGRGHAMTVVDDLSTGRASNLDAARAQGTIELIESDLADAISALAARAPFDRVYHLAAAVGVDLVLTDPVRAIEVNVETTAALLRHLAAHGSPPTLIASSSEVYGKPGTSVFSEDDDSLYGSTTVTRWSYAHAKALDEHLALGYHASRGLPTVIVRFFNTIGPRQRGNYGMVVPRFVEAALAGRPLRVFGDGRQSRCFCDVRDAVPALAALLDDPKHHGRVYNLGSDRDITIMELAEAVVRTLGSPSPIQTVPYSDAYPSGFEDLRQRRPDLARVKAAVGFEPAIPLEQTIADVARAMRAEHARAGGAS
jgi:UDP-glucose 4-epimerase